MKKVRRTYQTGNFREVREVYVSDRYRTRGTRKKGNARKSQMDSNLKTALRELLRILNGNFSYEQGDLLCTLNFETEPETRDEAWKIFAGKPLRELRKLAKERGTSCRLCAVVSDMDGDSREKVRTHLHVVIGGVTGEQVKACWPHGTVDVRTIRKEKTHARLAAYLLKQCRCAPDEKKWHTSRNLLRPQLIREEEVTEGSRYRLPKGAELIAQGEYCPEEGKLLDLQILMPEKPKKDVKKVDSSAHARGGTKQTRRRKKEENGRGGVNRE